MEAALEVGVGRSACVCGSGWAPAVALGRGGAQGNVRHSQDSSRLWGGGLPCWPLGFSRWPLLRAPGAAGPEVLLDPVAVFRVFQGARPAASWCRVGREPAGSLSIVFPADAPGPWQPPVTVSGRLDINRLLN